MLQGYLNVKITKKVNVNVTKEVNGMIQKINKIVSFILVVSILFFGSQSCKFFEKNNKGDKKNHSSARDKYFSDVEISSFEEALKFIDYNDYSKKELKFIFLPVQINENTLLRDANYLLNDYIYISEMWEPVHIEKINWDEDPYNHASWRLYFQDLSFLAFLHRAYEKTGDIKYLLKSQYYILDWINKNHIDLEIKSDYTWNDHATANRSKQFVDFLRLYRNTNVFDLEIFNIIVYSLYQHGKYLNNDDNYIDSNHGLMQDQALLQISTIFTTLPESEEWYDHSLERIHKSIETQITSEGVHKEHSPYYHIFVQDIYLSIQTYLTSIGINDNVIDNTTIKMDDYNKYIVTPNGYLPLISDTNFKHNPKVNYDSSLPDKVFKESGIAFFRDLTSITSSDIYLTFVAAYNSNYHKHKDDLSFTLNINDTDFFIDGGHFGYNPGSERSLLVSALSHNTITLNSEEWLFNEEYIGNPTIEKSFASEELSYIKASHTMYEKAKIIRSLIYIKPELIIIHDRLETSLDKYSSLQQIFNIGQDVDILKNNDGSFRLTSKLDNNYLNFKTLYPNDFIETIYNGSENPFIGWAAKYSGKMHPITTIIYNYPVKKHIDIFSAISINNPIGISKIKYESENDSYIFTLGEREYKVILE